MTLADELAIARFMHILALSVLLGGALFPFYGSELPATESYRRLTWLRALIVGAALFTVITGLYWFANVMIARDSPRLFAILGGNRFQVIWILRLVLAMGLVLLTLRRQPKRAHMKAIVGCASVLLASIALTGNSGSNDGALGFQHRLSDAVHLVASGVWIGALVVFSRLVTMSVRQDRPDDLQMVHDALARFAGVGTTTVAILTLSGMTNPGLFQSSLDTAYGQLLLAKLGVFGAMLALAGANRFFLTPRLLATLSGHGRLKAAINALRASILIETALGVIVLAMVGWLGVLPPPSFDPPRQFN